MWEVLVLDEVLDWLLRQDEATAEHFKEALLKLQEFGPHLGRPLVDTTKGSYLKNLKELRPASSGNQVIRVLFIFDHNRVAVILVAGNKRGDWSDWYKHNIAIAEYRYEEHIFNEI